MSRDLLDAVHDHRREVMRSVHNVQDVAEALYRVGLRELAEELYSHVRGLDASAERVVHAHTMDVKGQISHGEKMIGNMLTAIVNGNIVPTPAKAKDKST